jgi:hypothetical protein
VRHAERAARVPIVLAATWCGLALDRHLDRVKLLMLAGDGREEGELGVIDRPLVADGHGGRPARRTKLVEQPPSEAADVLCQVELPKKQRPSH